MISLTVHKVAQKRHEERIGRFEKQLAAKKNITGLATVEETLAHTLE